MAKLKLHITDNDIAPAERFKISNPVLHKLQNTTGTLWRLCDGGLAMEVMAPFRATLLPLWAARDWHRDAADYVAAPYELDLELYHVQANDGENGALDGSESLSDLDGSSPQKKMATKSALDYEVLQNALLQVLEYNGWSRWRAVCPHIFVEKMEPYRTIALTTDALHAAQEWLQSLVAPPCDQDGSTPHGSTPRLETALRLPAALHSPLTTEMTRQITITFPPRCF